MKHESIRKFKKGYQKFYKFGNGYGASEIFGVGGGVLPDMWEVLLLEYIFSGRSAINRSLFTGTSYVKRFSSRAETLEYLRAIKNAPDSNTRIKEKEILFRKFRI